MSLTAVCQEPTQAQIKCIIERAQAIKANAYAPYSKFNVGASLLCADGTIFDGCNVETCVMMSQCAERSAICTAIGEGHRDFLAIAVAVDGNGEPVAPCGICRQWLAEFNVDCIVFMAKKNGEFKRKTVRALLPDAFTPSMIEQ